MTCPACHILGAPPADCHHCGTPACHGCLHDGVCSLCIDVLRERGDQPPVGRAA